MLEGIRRWWTSLRHPDQTVYVTGANPIPKDDAERPIRIKVSCKGLGRTLRVEDAETGRAIPVTEFSMKASVSGSSIPVATFKTYLQDFEYEGPGYRFTFCPRCKEQVRNANPDAAC